MSDISSYLNDHGNAGNCAYHCYNGTHDPAKCPASPGTCAVIGYLVSELRHAEHALASVAPPQPFPSVMPPLSPSGAFQETQGASGAGAAGTSVWHGPGGAHAETR